MRPRTTVPVVRRQVPQPLTAVELERIRCAARSGVADTADVLRLLDHAALQERAIVQIGQRTDDFGTPEERARVAAATELVAENPPVHVRIEFDVDLGPRPSFEHFVSTVRGWTLNHVADLADAGHVTVTYRGQTEDWETPLP